MEVVKGRRQLGIVIKEDLPDSRVVCEDPVQKDHKKVGILSWCMSLSGNLCDMSENIIRYYELPESSTVIRPVVQLLFEIILILSLKNQDL